MQQNRRNQTCKDSLMTIVMSICSWSLFRITVVCRCTLHAAKAVMTGCLCGCWHTSATGSHDRCGPHLAAAPAWAQEWAAGSGHAWALPPGCAPGCPAQHTHLAVNTVRARLVTILMYPEMGQGQWAAGCACDCAPPHKCPPKCPAEHGQNAELP